MYTFKKYYLNHSKNEKTQKKMFIKNKKIQNVIITYSIQQRARYCIELTEYTCTQSCTVMYFRILYGRRKKLSPNDFTENIRQLKQTKKKFHNNYRIVVKSTVVCFFVLFPAIYLCHLIIIYRTVQHCRLSFCSSEHLKNM